MAHGGAAVTTVLPEDPAGEPPRADDAAEDSGTGARRPMAWLLVVTGGLGLLASLVLTLDGIELLRDPDFVPSCNVSPVLSCTSVMRSDQASLFGVPNPVLGLAAYAAVAALGAGLLAGARYRRRLWLGLHLGTLLGVGFCMWLMTQALYEIGTLCLWCCLTWAVTITMFWYVTVLNLRHGLVRAPRALAEGVREFHWAVPVTWCLIIVVLIGVRFWTYWRSLL